jgi:transcriptional regulator with XRE-family HTH domain
MGSMNTLQSQPVGHLLRAWRQRRRMSQLELALEAEISSKHLSFLETGRSTPSREMLLRLVESLAVPLREQNVMLVAAGYAPIFPERPLDAPELQQVRQAVDLVLAGHEPYPALAIDRHWTLVAANRAIPPLLVGADPALLQPPVNVIRLSLHPGGLAPRIANYAEWRAHLLSRLRLQVDVSADPLLVELLRETAEYRAPAGLHRRAHTPPHSGAGVAVPLRLRTEAGELAFISTTTVFGTPIDITVAELAIESFFPADATTAAAMRRFAAQP